MSSRARLVEQETRPYDWRGTHPAPMLHRQIVQTLDLPEELQAPAGELLNESRLAEIERDAHAEGYERGERAGAEAAAAAARGLLQRLAETIGELSSTRQDVLRRSERQVVELAMAIAKHMLQRELSVDRGLLLAMARVALDGLGDHEAATIRLHPDDYAIVNASSSDRALASDEVTIVADPAVEQGGCLVQCGGGLMTVGLESQFNELARALLGEQAGPADRAEARHGATVPS